MALGAVQISQLLNDGALLKLAQVSQRWVRMSGSP